VSTLESVIWHILGYSAIPLIFLTGIFLSSLILFILLGFFGRDKDE